MLCGLVAFLVLVLPTRARADEAEDKAVADIEKRGGRVTRDAKAPSKSVVEVSLDRTVGGGSNRRGLIDQVDVSRHVE